MGIRKRLAGRFSRINRKDLQIVLLCLLTAMTFWFFNALNENYTTRITHPVQFKYDHDAVVVIGELPGRIALEVTGLGWNLFRRSLNFSRDPVEIMLEEPSEVRYFNVNTLQSRLQDELGAIKINYIITDTLYFNFEKKMDRRLKLSLDSTAIDLAENHELAGNITISPDSVWVTGPESTIDQLTEPLGLTLPEDGISESFDQYIEISIPGSQYLEFQPPTVQIVFNVLEREMKEIEVPLDSVAEIMDGRISDRVFRVTYWQLVTSEENYQPEDFSLYLGPEQVNPVDSSALPVIIRAPEAIRDPTVASDSISVSK